MNGQLKLFQIPAFSADNLKRHARKLMYKYVKEVCSSTVDACLDERDPIRNNLGLSLCCLCWVYENILKFG